MFQGDKALESNFEVFAFLDIEAPGVLEAS